MVEITIKNLVFGYNSHKILDGVNIIVKSSEILSLVGP
ncbi:MAG: ABC transporter ATP-binding protein, partial [Methanosarcinales archaeon]|nr:ABC transporter ATP-binding protein [Methanosarcinales archaeon]